MSLERRTRVRFSVHVKSLGSTTRAEWSHLKAGKLGFLIPCKTVPWRLVSYCIQLDVLLLRIKPDGILVDLCCKIKSQSISHQTKLSFIFHISFFETRLSMKNSNYIHCISGYRKEGLSLRKAFLYPVLFLRPSKLKPNSNWRELLPILFLR